MGTNSYVKSQVKKNLRAQFTERGHWTTTLTKFYPILTPSPPRVDKCGHSTLWQYGLWSFQTGGTKLERFLHKNRHPQRKLLNFENWISGGLRSFQKSDF